MIIMYNKEIYDKINDIMYKTRLYGTFFIYGKQYIGVTTAENVIRAIQRTLKLDNKTTNNLLDSLRLDNKIYYCLHSQLMVYSDRLCYECFENWLFRKINEILE